MNIYIQIIKDLSYDNKYLKWYVNIIENAQDRASSRKEAKEKIIYAVGHHIALESFFKNRKREGLVGNVEGNPDDVLNIVYLTPREHLIVHRCLSKCLINRMHIAKNTNAVCRMLQSKDGTYKITARTYDILMKQFIDNNPGKWESSVNKAKQTKLERYGDENYSNLEQAKETCLERYGVDHYSKTEQYNETFTNTMLERYGVKHALQIEEAQEKFKKTCLENNGVEYPMQSKNIQQKSVETRLEKYGVEYNMQSEIFREMSKKSCLEKYGVDNPGKRIVICEHCGESKNINHVTGCKKNPNRKVRDIKGKNNQNTKYYKVVSPENEIKYIMSKKNLLLFAKETNLAPYSFVGNRVEGWMIETISKKEYFDFHQ